MFFIAMAPDALKNIARKQEDPDQAFMDWKLFSV